MEPSQEIQAVENSNPMQSQQMTAAAQAMAGTSFDPAYQTNMLQAQVVTAKTYARNLAKVKKEVIEEFSDPNLAENSLYRYPKGGQQVEGLSIRSAEAIAYAMGNIEYGVIEVEQTETDILLEAFAWDIERNVRRSIRWRVPMKRTTRQGTTNLTDERDRYEMMANMGSRRVRAMLLALIPVAIQTLAVNTIRETLINSGRLLSPENLNKLMTAFAKRGITDQHLQKFLGHPLEQLTVQDALNLSCVSQSIAHGIGKAEDFFPGFIAPKKENAHQKGTTAPSESTSRITEKLRSNQS